MANSPKRILVVAAHADDDILGAGGTIAKHVANDDVVGFCFLADGESSRFKPAQDEEKKEAIEKREQHARTVAQMVGAEEPMFGRFEDQKLDIVPLLDLTKKVEEAVEKVKPSIIYTNSSADLNIDHQLAARAVLIACRPKPGFSVKKILAFETASSTEWSERPRVQFAPTMYVNITGFIDRKLELLKVYEDEARAYPHPRSPEGIRARAQSRGTEAGYHYAEAFEVLRILKD